MLVMIMAKLIQTTNEKVVYIYDGNMDPDNVDFKNVGIVEFDYCVFENAPNTIDAMYLLQNMEDSNNSHFMKKKLFSCYCSIWCIYIHYTYYLVHL